MSFICQYENYIFYHEDAVSACQPNRDVLPRFHANILSASVQRRDYRPEYERLRKELVRARE